MDLTTPEGVRSYMSQSTSKDDWNQRCDAVKAANGSDYPSFWFETVVMSGLVDQTLGSGSSDISIIELR